MYLSIILLLYSSKLKTSISEINYENITFEWDELYRISTKAHKAHSRSKFEIGLRDSRYQYVNVTRNYNVYHKRCKSYMHFPSFLTITWTVIWINSYRKKLAKIQQLIDIKLMQIPLFFPIMKFRGIILREKIKVIHTSCINGENTIMDERYSQFKKIIKLHIIILNYVFKSNLPLAMFNSSLSQLLMS